MTFQPRLSPGTSTPADDLYEQISRAIASGELAGGDRLPSVRTLAGQLGLAAGTVAKVYRELEGNSLVVTARGAGTRVAARSGAAPTARLATLTADFVTAARKLGVEDATIRAALEERLQG